MKPRKYLFILLLLAACSHPTPKIVLPKRNIVLIQGVHLDDSSWKDVKDRLTLQNFNVVTLNRIGRDGVEPSLKAIAKASCEVIPENSIMVGHSYAGAIINARVPAVVYGAKEPNFGSCGSVLNLFEERYGHHPAIYGGVLSEDCAAALRAFFGGLRG